ncbi:MAG: hypothetical protein JXQ71_10855 [Verrucomicrobia bacterium]|nr:hypothetical protein [Verrucomicrobiota bacterium]
MNGRSPDEPLSLTLGNSRLGRLPDRWEHTLVSPGANPVIKHESQTLVWRLPWPDGPQTIVKLYRRRGLLHRFRGRLLPFRVQREFHALCILADGGVPCSPPLAWGWGHAPQHGRFEFIVTGELAGAVNLKERLAAPAPEVSPDDLLHLFRLLRRMHARGVYHGALSPKNIMVPASPRPVEAFHLIDLARAVWFPGDIAGSAMARLDLLSLLRRLCQMRPGWGCQPFLLAYGLPERDLRGFSARLNRFHPTRHTRNWLALRFRLRAAVARRRRGAS